MGGMIPPGASGVESSRHRRPPTRTYVRWHSPLLGAEPAAVGAGRVADAGWPRGRGRRTNFRGRNMIFTVRLILFSSKLAPFGGAWGWSGIRAVTISTWLSRLSLMEVSPTGQGPHQAPEKTVRRSNARRAGGRVGRRGIFLAPGIAAAALFGFVLDRAFFQFACHARPAVQACTQWHLGRQQHATQHARVMNHDPSRTDAAPLPKARNEIQCPAVQ